MVRVARGGRGQVGRVASPRSGVEELDVVPLLAVLLCEGYARGLCEERVLVALECR